MSRACRLPLGQGRARRHARLRPMPDAPGGAHDDDIELAFAHPEERAEASASADPRDRISLRDHVVEADIGAFQKERGHKQRLRFNVVVEVRPAPAPLDDDVDRILSYDRITEAIAAELAAERLNLLETLAERVAERILAEPAAMRAFIRIEKAGCRPLCPGGRDRAQPRRTCRCSGGRRRRRCIRWWSILDNAAIAAPDLGAGSTAAGRGACRLILTVGLPDLPRPVTGHKPTQRRVDLLAIEQNAWTLAARDPRCVVVATRTEIDWAIRRGQIGGLGAVQAGAGRGGWPEGHRPGGAGAVAGRDRWRPRRWLFTAMLQSRQEAACRSKNLLSLDPLPRLVAWPSPPHAMEYFRPHRHDRSRPTGRARCRLPVAGAGSTGSRCCRAAGRRPDAGGEVPAICRPLTARPRRFRQGWRWTRPG
jgi:dihydroneopterin aldolase